MSQSAEAAEAVLQDGTAVIPSNADLNQVKEILGKALVKNADQVDLSSLEWEYECEGKNGLLKNTAWGSINYDAVRQNIFDTVVESTTPELTVSDVTIEYYATATTGSLGDVGKAWMPLEGGKSGTPIALTYPAMGTGSQKIKISYAGTDTYFGASAEATVNIGIGKEESEIALKADQSVALVYNDDLTIDYAAVKEAIMDQVVDTENSRPEGLSLDNLTIEYYATAEIGAVGSLGKAWAPITRGFKITK